MEVFKSFLWGEMKSTKMRILVMSVINFFESQALWTNITLLSEWTLLSTSEYLVFKTSPEPLLLSGTFSNLWECLTEGRPLISQCNGKKTRYCSSKSTYDMHFHFYLPCHSQLQRLPTDFHSLQNNIFLVNANIQVDHSWLCACGSLIEIRLIIEFCVKTELKDIK